MKYTFNSYGHENVIGTHRSTLEFTKDRNLTKNGDCIIGVGSDFETEKVLEIVSASKDKIKMTIEWPNGYEEVVFTPNENFNNNHEIVVRKTSFLSDRTLGIKADKASFELNRDLISFLKLKNSKITIILENNS